MCGFSRGDIVIRNWKEELMTISLNSSQAAGMAENHGSRVVPAAAVWEPVDLAADHDYVPEVRRLGPGIRTHRLGRGCLGVGSGAAAAQPGSAVPMAHRTGTPWIGEIAQSYLVGGLFGLSLVVGAVLAGPSDDPMPVTPTQQAVESAR